MKTRIAIYITRKINNLIYKALLFKKRGISISTSITWRCNRYCPYCLVDLTTGTRPISKESSLKEWIEYMDSFPIKIKQVSVSGGEPTLHPDFTEIVTYYLNKDISVVIYSNLHNYKKILAIRKSKNLKIYTTYHKGMNETFHENLKSVQAKHFVIYKEFRQIEESMEGSQKHDLLEVEDTKRKPKGWLYVNPALGLYVSCYEKVMYGRDN